MKQSVKRGLGIGVLLALANPMALSPLSAAPRSKSTIYEPKPGSRERRAIFDALRIPVSRQVRNGVVFQGRLKATRSGWAFFSGGALIADGSGGGHRIDDGGSNGEMVALLRKSSGKWRVLSWGFGGGMDATEEAMKKYPQAPRALFR